MAKMRVYELAKELDVTSKEILNFLSERDIQVKSHSSSLKEEQISFVRKNFRKGSSSLETTPDAEEESAQKKERPKKKASISAVYNPQNSKMGNQKGGRGNRGGQTRVTNERQPRPPRPKRERPARPEGEQKKRLEGERPPRPRRRRQMRPEGERSPRIRRKRPARPEGERQEHQEEKPQEKLTGERQEGATDKRQERATDKRQERATDKRQGELAAKPPEHRTGGQEETARGGDRPARRLSGGQKRQGEGKNDRFEKVDSRSQNNRKDNKSRAGDNQGGRNRKADSQGRFRDTGNRTKKSEAKTARDSGKSSTDKSRGKSSRNNEGGNNRKKKQNYDRRRKRQENYVNLEKKTGHKKRNATPQTSSQKKTDEIRTIVLPEAMTIRQLADIMKVQPSEIVKKLFLQGVMITVNQEVDYEKAEEIALEFNCIAEPEEKVDVIAELLKEDSEDESAMVARSPVVCVMGHVDHGKTSLLDAIRNTRVTEREAGGITQAIGASVVSIGGRNITFLDTPGHEAFTAMRMRGANSTDIAILVIAADDGVMPQTVEAINHAKAAGVEIVVAINKIDKEGANVEKVKEELMKFELVPEDWGGKTICVPISAHTGEGIEELLEMVLLTADVLELKANPNRNARGLVIEAQLDRGRGAVATVLVQKGTLKIGQCVAAGSSYGKVRAMVDDSGKRVKEAGPSVPVEVLGLGSVPSAGEAFVVRETEREARDFAETFRSQDKEKLLAETRSRMSLDDLFSRIREGNLQELDLIVKADAQGSVEAVKESLEGLSNEDILVKVIHGSVGAINESDISLAAASNAIVIGFNVKPDSVARSSAERENVDVRLYNVIYKATEDIEAAMKGMLEPVYREQVIGHAEIRQIFKASGVGNIAGSYVTDGLMERGCSIRIFREDAKIYDGSLASLKRFKDDVREVKAGYECGLVFEGFGDIEERDVVEAYQMAEVPR